MTAQPLEPRELKNRLNAIIRDYVSDSVKSSELIKGMVHPWDNPQAFSSLDTLLESIPEDNRGTFLEPFFRDFQDYNDIMSCLDAYSRIPGAFASLTKLLLIEAFAPNYAMKIGDVARAVNQPEVIALAKKYDQETQSLQPEINTGVVNDIFVIAHYSLDSELVRDVANLTAKYDKSVAGIITHKIKDSIYAAYFRDSPQDYVKKRALGKVQMFGLKEVIDFVNEIIRRDDSIIGRNKTEEFIGNLGFINDKTYSEEKPNAHIARKMVQLAQHDYIQFISQMNYLALVLNLRHDRRDSHGQLYDDSCDIADMVTDNLLLRVKVEQLRKLTAPSSPGQKLVDYPKPQNPSVLANEIDDILNGAIARYPHLATAVEIVVKADVSGDYMKELGNNSRASFKEYLGLLKMSLDFLFGTFVQMVGQSGELPTKTANSRFVEHLPYANKLKQSNCLPHSMYLFLPNQRRGQQLRIDLAGSYDATDIPVDFLPSEVVSIKLVDARDSEFRALLSVRKNQTPDSGRFEIKSSPSALEHYLYYSGFSSYQDGLLLPHHRLQLLEVSSGSVTGYAAVRQITDGRYEKVVLYEFSGLQPQGIEIPEKMKDASWNPKSSYEGDVNTFLLQIIKQGHDTYGDKIKKYEGKEAIERLHKLGVRQRF